MKTIILVSGKLQSGKNQFATYLSKIFRSYGYTVRDDLFAKGVKDGVRQDFKEVFDYLNTFDIPELKTTEDSFYENKTKLTRMFLQIYGTEIFRNKVDNDWWVKQLIIRAKESKEDVTLITDVRFPNEVDLVESSFKYGFNVYKIRVERDVDRNDSTNEHSSETSLDDYNDWDCVISNNGTLNDLYDKATYMSTIIKV